MNNIEFCEPTVEWQVLVNGNSTGVISAETHSTNPGYCEAFARRRAELWRERDARVILQRRVKQVSVVRTPWKEV